MTFPPHVGNLEVGPFPQTITLTYVGNPIVQSKNNLHYSLFIFITKIKAACPYILNV